jgi:dCTP diphosphatase
MPTNELSISSLSMLVEAFNSDRGWRDFHTPKNLACAIVSESAELLELFQWLTPEQSQKIDTEYCQAVTAEMADILIFMLTLANTLQIDLAEAVINKLEKNAIKYPTGKSFDPFGKQRHQKQELTELSPAPVDAV